ncbi:MAG TPA: hypothetical protein VIU64_07190, partial [Polyangia bacterium]
MKQRGHFAAIVPISSVVFSVSVGLCLGVVGTGACQSGNQGAGGSGGKSGGTSGSGGSAASDGGTASGGSTGSGGASGTGGAAATGGSSGSDGGTDSGPDDGAPAPVTCVPPTNKDQPVEKLSDTGCMDPKQPTKFAPGAVAYDVNSPLWSDRADKERGFFLPRGGKVHVLDCAKEPDACRVGPQDTGRFVFPVGTVMVKSFAFDGKLVETRLFVHFDADTWVGYSYAWNTAQTEATIVPSAGQQVDFDTGSRSVHWAYPSRQDCMECHAAWAGSTLGPEMRQLNRVVGGQNQIDRFANAGLFDEAPKAPYQEALAMPYAGSWGPASDSASVEQKARSYLHANCAFCHRPDGNFPGFDIRLGVALADTTTCNVTPSRGEVDVPGAMLITPGSHAKSTMWL